VAPTRAAIVEQLSSGNCTRSLIARDLGLSQPVLRQRLSERGAGFHGLMDEARGNPRLAV
jgi:predicted transcriptional regulator